ncbi:HK97-gp10 family putative phage morphogenesis protein [Methylorubrum extorquens]|uniref:HK97-gp10 family putative phage morphogenesis protein n=1 Tax=Methylorubrum extorquens TaxID=408 RepID=UPI003F61C24E
MATVKVDARLAANLRGVTAAVEGEVFKAIYAAADIIAAEAALSITRGSVSGKNHVPSAPGQPPNADTRQLDTNIIVRPDRPRLAAQIITQAPYSAHLEYGTARMAARPFMRPALLDHSQTALALIQRSVARATRK